MKPEKLVTGRVKKRLIRDYGAKGVSQIQAAIELSVKRAVDVFFKTNGK